MKTQEGTEREAKREEQELSILRQGAEVLEALSGRIGRHFGQTPISAADPCTSMPHYHFVVLVVELCLKDQK